MPGAIEEVLRLRPPLPRLARITTTDTEIGGHAVPAGDLVTPWIAAANRDAARFPDPDRFDIHRNTGGSQTFGQGIHFCLGAPLARLEAKDDPGAYRTNVNLHSNPQHLPHQW